MKRKFLSVLTIALTVVLFVCALSITVSAEEASVTPKVSIDKFNLVFEDNVYLKYAVKFDGVDDNNITSDNVGMLYFTEPQSEYIEGNENYSSSVVGHTTIDEQKYYTFEYRHISAKMITDYIYSVAYINIDGERYYSAPVKYSVLDYCYSKLGKTGTASENENFKALLSATMEQGAAAQKYFNYKTDRLANAEYYLVEVEGGTLEDGFTKGLYLSTDTVTLTAEQLESEYIFDRWIDQNGNTMSYECSFEFSDINSNTRFEAVYKENSSSGLDFKLSESSDYYIVSGIGKCLDTVIRIPSTYNDMPVTHIEEYAFKNCGTITEVIVPKTIVSIGKGAFYGCDSVQKMTLPFIGNTRDASSYCGPFGYIFDYHATSSDEYDGDGEYQGNWSGKNYYYYIPSSIKEIVVTDDETISDYAFYNCGAVNSVTFDDATKVIGNKAFTYCTYLRNLTLPRSLTAIGGSVFYHCINLYSIYLPSTVSQIGYGGFFYCPNLTIYCADGINTEKWDPNWNATSNTSSACEVIWGIQDSGVTDNFSWICTASDEIIILSYLENDTDVVIPNTINNFPVVKIADAAFFNNESIVSLQIPNNVKEIGSLAFKGCTNLNRLTIGAGLASLGDNIFQNCYSLTDIKVSTDNSTYCDIDNNLCSKDERTLICYFGGSSATTYTTPETIVEICDNAFCTNPNLNTIVLSDSVNAITENTFKNIISLKHVTLGNGITTIPDRAFSSTSIETIILGNNVTTIGKYAFSQCSKLTEITLPDSVTTIEDYAFQYCNSLETVTIGKRLETIGAESFNNCIKLKELYLPDTLTTINSRAFQSCTSLIGINIGNNVKYIGHYAFSSCVSLTIYCKRASAYGGWSSYWNSTSIPVVWNWDDTSVVYSFQTNADKEIAPITSKYGIYLPLPTKEGFYFGGWYTNTNFEGEALSLKSPYSAKDDTTLYAKWLTEEEYFASLDGSSFLQALIIDPNGGNYQVVIDEAGERVYFKFIPTESKTYYIEAITGGDTYGYLYNGSESLLKSNDDANDDTSSFLIKYSLVAGETYYIVARYYSDSKTGTFSISIY